MKNEGIEVDKDVMWNRIYKIWGIGAARGAIETNEMEENQETEMEAGCIWGFWRDCSMRRPKRLECGCGVNADQFVYYCSQLLVPYNSLHY